MAANHMLTCADWELIERVYFVLYRFFTNKSITPLLDHKFTFHTQEEPEYQYADDEELAKKNFTGMGDGDRLVGGKIANTK